MADSYIVVRGERPIDLLDPESEQLTNALIDKEVFFSTTANDTTFRVESNIFTISVRVKKSDAVETYHMLTKHNFEVEIKRHDWDHNIEKKSRDSSEKTNYIFYISEDEEIGNSFFAILETCGIGRDRVNTVETEGFKGHKQHPYQDHRLTVDMIEAKKLAAELFANDQSFAVAPIELECLIELKKQINIIFTPGTLTLNDFIYDHYCRGPIEAQRLCKERPITELVAESPKQIKDLLEKYRGIKLNYVMFREIEFTKNCFDKVLKEFKDADLKIGRIGFECCAILDVDDFCAFLVELGCSGISLVACDSIGKHLYKILQHEGISKKLTYLHMKLMQFSMNFGQTQNICIGYYADAIRFEWDTEFPLTGRISTKRTSSTSRPLLHPVEMKSFTNLVGEHEVVNSPLTDLIYTVDEEFNYTLTTIHKFEASTD